MTAISMCILCPWQKEFNSAEWARKELDGHRYIVHGIEPQSPQADGAP